MEGNNEIFLAGHDALWYQARPIHKKYSMRFIWGHPFSTSRSQNQFFDPSQIPPCSHMFTFRVPLSFACVISLILPLFAIVSSYCFTSEIQESMTHLKKPVSFFVSDTHHFLASQSVPSSLPRDAFSIMVASNFQLFYFS